MEISDINFVIVSEPWNEYQLEDGTILKFRFILKRVKKEKISYKQIDYSFESQNLVVITKIPTHLIGEPDSTPKEIKKENLIKEINFSIKKEDWNEYMFSDGAKLRIKASIITVYRTNLYDKNGEPIYYVESSIQGKITPPERNI